MIEEPKLQKEFFLQYYRNDKIVLNQSEGLFLNIPKDQDSQ